MLHQPKAAVGRPRIEAVNRFLGQVSDPGLFLAAVVAKARSLKRKNPGHLEWLLGVLPELDFEPAKGMKSSDFLGVCMEFTGPKNEKGYGRFDAALLGLDGKPLPSKMRKKMKGRGKNRREYRVFKSQHRVHWAHRFAFLLANGHLPAEHVGHRHELTGNDPACVNPFHLMEQSLLENVAELNERMHARRHAGGKSNRPSKAGRKIKPLPAMADGIPF